MDLVAGEEEDEAEEDDAEHHGEGGGIVRESDGDEALVLIVTERADDDVVAVLEVRVTGTAVGELEGEDSVDIRDLELGAVVSLSVVDESGSDVGVDHLELELEVVSIEGRPLLSVPLLDVKAVLDEFADGVGVLLLGLSDKVVLHIAETQHLGLLEGPLGDLGGEIKVSSFAVVMIVVAIVLLGDFVRILMIVSRKKERKMQNRERKEKK